MDVLTRAAERQGESSHSELLSIPKARRRIPRLAASRDVFGRALDRELASTCANTSKLHFAPLANNDVLDITKVMFRDAGLVQITMQLR